MSFISITSEASTSTLRSTTPNDVDAQHMESARTMASLLPRGPGGFNVFHDREERKLPPLSEALFAQRRPSQASIGGSSQYTYTHYTKESSPSRLGLRTPPALIQQGPATPATTPTSEIPSSWTSPDTISRMSVSEFVDFMFPTTSTRKPMHSSSSGKRKGPATDYKDPKHAELEKFRRGRLSDLFKAVGQALPDHFVELAGWKADKSQPESKEQIMQAEKYWRETVKQFLLAMCQNGEEAPRYKDRTLEEILQASDEKAKLELKALNLERENHMLIGRCVQLEKNLDSVEMAKSSEINILKQDVRMLRQQNMGLEEHIQHGSMSRGPEPAVLASPFQHTRKRSAEVSTDAAEHMAKRRMYDTLPSISTHFTRPPPSPASTQGQRRDSLPNFSTLSPSTQAHDSSSMYNHQSQYRHHYAPPPASHHHQMPCSPPFSGRNSPECPQ